MLIKWPSMKAATVWMARGSSRCLPNSHHVMVRLNLDQEEQKEKVPGLGLHHPQALGNYLERWCSTRGERETVQELAGVTPAGQSPAPEGSSELGKNLLEEADLPAAPSMWRILLGWGKGACGREKRSRAGENLRVPGGCFPGNILGKACLFR